MHGRGLLGIGFLLKLIGLAVVVAIVAWLLGYLKLPLEIRLGVEIKAPSPTPTPTPALTPTPTPTPVPIEEFAANQCVALCESELAAGRNLSAGPCLSNEIAPGWVCDVAHDPRQPIDNLPENQCSAWREGLAAHFVEVTPECQLIKKV